MDPTRLLEALPPEDRAVVRRWLGLCRIDSPAGSLARALRTVAIAGLAREVGRTARIATERDAFLQAARILELPDSAADAALRTLRSWRAESRRARAAEAESRARAYVRDYPRASARELAAVTGCGASVAARIVAEGSSAAARDVA